MSDETPAPSGMTEQTVNDHIEFLSGLLSSGVELATLNDLGAELTRARERETRARRAIRDMLGDLSADDSVSMGTWNRVNAIATAALNPPPSGGGEHRLVSDVACSCGCEAHDPCGREGCPHESDATPGERANRCGSCSQHERVEKLEGAIQRLPFGSDIRVMATVIGGPEARETVEPLAQRLDNARALVGNADPAPMKEAWAEIEQLHLDPGGQASPYEVPDSDLPGMWEGADFMGGDER